MSRASYQRQPSADSVVYTIEPIPKAKARVAGSGPVMLVAQTVVIAFLSLIPGFLVGAALHPLFGLAVVIAIPVFFVRWMRSRGEHLLGRRERSQISVLAGAVHVSVGNDRVEVPRDAIRRLVVGNTYAEHRETDPQVVAVNPGAGQTAGAAILARVDQKQPMVCYSLALHHANEQTLLADGLDELTANNLSDDLGRDLGLD